MTYRDCDNDCGPECPDYPCEALAQAAPPFWVYVAGRLSGDPGLYLANVAEMSRTSRRLMELDFCPINPAADLVEGLMSPEPLPVAAYQRRSLQLLELLSAAAADSRAALLVLSYYHPDGRPSAGVATEVAFCKQHGIPVVDSISALLELRRTAA